MPAERYFHHGPFAAEEVVTLTGAEAHHLVNVMRGTVGDQVEVIDGKGSLAKATVREIHRKHGVELAVTQVTHKRPPERGLILVQAIPRLSRLDCIVQVFADKSATVRYRTLLMYASPLVPSDCRTPATQHISTDSIQQINYCSSVCNYKPSCHNAPATAC